MAFTTFSGPVRSLNGFISYGPGAVVNVPDGTNTLSATVADHAGRIVRVNDATLVVTLPTIVAVADPVSSGPGSDPNTPSNVGTTFTFFIDTSATNVKFTTDGTDKFAGSVLMVDTDSGGAVTGFAPAATNDALNLNGSTTGGIAGTWVRFTALSALEYFVEGVVLASGAVVSPFADA